MRRPSAAQGAIAVISCGSTSGVPSGCRVPDIDLEHRSDQAVGHGSCRDVIGQPSRPVQAPDPVGKAYRQIEIVQDGHHGGALAARAPRSFHEVDLMPQSRP